MQVRAKIRAGLLLAVLLLRAYVPVGFMPAHGLTLEICPEGLPANPHAHHGEHQGHDSHAQFAHCPFGSLPGAGPVLHAFTPPVAVPLNEHPAERGAASDTSSRLKRAQSARAPPVLA